MQRATGIAAVIRRAAVVASSAHQIPTPLTQSCRLSQSAPYSGFSSGKPDGFLPRLVDYFNSPSPYPVRRGFAGIVFFSVAASLAQEAHAKEPTSSLRDKEVVLYQYEACPFCNKVKAFLDYYDIPYKIVEVNPISKKEIKWSDYRKVPIVTVDGEQLVNSSDIIDNLYKRMNADKPYMSSDEEKEWLGWVDDHLVHVLSPNIYRTVGEALESFDYITSHGNFTFMEKVTAKYAGATAMYFVSKKLKKKYNITDERGALYESAETWVDALKGRDFLGGMKPNLADLAVFGVLRPIRHLRSGKDMVENTRIGNWYSRMEEVVGESARDTIV
ncbi:hypothetical protein V2J09_023922 [Rumex salicifolius]